MAHFAKINSKNIVTEVLAVDNSLEDRGAEFLAKDLGLGGTWIQTSYNGNFRKNYAGIGMSYDKTRDAFIPEQCHESAVLNEDTCQWECADQSHERPVNA